VSEIPFEVPAAGAAEHRWFAQDDGMSSRRKVLAASGTYFSAVPAKIADFAPLIPADLAADAEEAVAALKGFDDYAQRVLETDSPMLGLMSSILLRTESASSSQIENLTVGARQLALAELDQASSENAKLVIGNVRAMEAALSMSERIDEAAICAMQAEMISLEPGLSAYAGKYRDQLVWVGSSSLGPRGALHVAPQADLVPEAMQDLIAFVARDDLPVILQAAIAHAQFETIHPFIDGNGRTGRALVHAMLKAKAIVTHTTAPISAGLLIDTSSYFAALGAYRTGNARPIVERFSDAARFAASSGADLVDALAAELSEARELLSGVRPQSTVWKVLPYLIANPIVDAAYLETQLNVDPATVQRALQQLVAAGVLQERTGKRRGRIYQHSGILDVLDAYAESLLRR
jgi:Fic family protein